MVCVIHHELNTRGDLTELSNDQLISAPRIKVRHMTLKFGVGDLRKVSDDYIRVIYGRLDIDLIVISGDRMYDIRIRYRSVFHGVHLYIT